MKRQHITTAIKSLAECLKLSKDRDELLTYQGLIELLIKLANREEYEK